MERDMVKGKQYEEFLL